MHIPDGFLANRIALSFDAISGAGILLASRRLKLELYGRMVPVMGVLSAFVFAAQMLNFPVFGGTSGHLVGGALLGIVLGPFGGLITMATVVIAQALFLQDGGLLALGANIFNIGAVPVFAGYAVFRLLGSPAASGRLLAAAGFLAGWLSIVVSSAVCALELALSGAIPLRIGLPAMTLFHSVIGVVEGALTAGVLSFLAQVRPDLIRGDAGAGFRWGDWIGGIAFVSIPLAILAMAGSSSLPDPLQALIAVQYPTGHGDEGLPAPGGYPVFRVLLPAALLLLILAACWSALAVRGRRGPS
jgi:cobalt/nickel transport system permease protein